MTTSSRHTTSNSQLAIERKMLMVSWNVFGEFFSLDDILKNLHSQWCNAKVSFSLCLSAISICQYSESAFYVKSMSSSPSESKHLSIWAVGKASLTVTTVSDLYFMENRIEPSYFKANTIGDAHSECAGSITIIRHIWTIFACQIRVHSVLGPVQEQPELIKRTGAFI